MSSYLKMVDQTRLSNYLGLKMVDGYELTRCKFSSRNYAYIEIPVLHFLNTTDGETSKEAKRNSYVQVVPACTVDTRGSYRFEIHPDQKLFQFGMAQSSYYVEPESGLVTPSIYVWLRKDINLADLDYAIRIYMRD